MKVTALQLYLRSLQSAVAATDPGSPIPGELESACAGLEPFADLDIGRFAAFLRQAQEYQASGAVPLPPPGGIAAEKVQESLRAAASVADQLADGAGADAASLADGRNRARQELEQALAAFLKPLSVGVSLKDDRKG